MSEGKQIFRVLQAIEGGCRTSAEIGTTTGLSTKLASHYVSELIKSGTVRRNGIKKQYPGRGGQYQGFEVAS